MHETESTDVCLVNMPMAGITRPSLALGLLKSLLQDQGIGTTVTYPNIWYVEFIGPSQYSTLLGPRTEECLVDWLFAPAAFPDLEADDAAFLDMLCRNHPEFASEDGPSRLSSLQAIRERTPEFINWTARKILERQPQIVGCTSTFQQHVASLALLRRIRELAPQVTTIMGGANCETHMGKTTHQSFPWVDFVVSGEADTVVAPLFGQILDHGRELSKDVLLPPHVFTPRHRKEGYPVRNGGDGLARGTTADLTILPLPNYDDYFFREVPEFIYQKHLLPGLPYESSRGCWWGERSHCTFCGLNGGGMGFRSKGADQVLEEIHTLVDRYGFRRIETVDNIIDMAYFESVLPRLAKSEPKLNLFYETKSNLKKAQIQSFRAAGVRWIQPGIESMSSEVLKLIGKGVKAYQNLQTLKWCRQYGIKVFWNIIAGFPGEKDSWYQEIAEIIPKIEHLQPGNFSQLRYDRYSPYFNQQEKFDLKLRPCRQYEAVYPLSEDKLYHQAYFFTDDNHNLAPKLVGDEFPGLATVFQQVTRWRDAWPAIPRLEWDKLDPLCLIDERQCASRERHSLTPDHRRLLEACDAALTPAKLNALSGTLSGGQPIAALIEELQTWNLLLQVDGRFLNLVLDDPEPLPPVPDFPGGNFSVPQRKRPARSSDKKSETTNRLDILT